MSVYGNDIFRESDNNNEVLNEITVFYGNLNGEKGENSMLITVDCSGATERNFHKDPYFKVFPNGKRNGPVARIKVKEAKYERGHAGNKVVKLKREERIRLDKILSSTITDENNNKCTVWDKLVEAVKKETGGKSEDYYEKKDYRNIEEA